MKGLLLPFLLLTCTAFGQRPVSSSIDTVTSPTQNLIIVTIDGFRWQELFTGADEQLINDPAVTPDTATMKAMYWHSSGVERRKKLMPFVWNVLASKGQLHGNRHYDNKMNVSNVYAVSYPGYHELFTGKTLIDIRSNKRKKSRYPNVLEFLNSRDPYKGKVAAFSSWDVLPFILNEERAGFSVNGGYEKQEDASLTASTQMSEELTDQDFFEKKHTRFDQLTFIAAKEYMRTQQPKVVYIGWGEADEFAHEARYDLYLEQANKVDRMLAELWHFIQTTEGYKNNTIILITTDHGRGAKDANWNKHHTFVKGSTQTWTMMIGPGIEALGEIKSAEQGYQWELAEWMANILGESFDAASTKK